MRHAMQHDKTTRSFAVIGLGTFGSTVATELARFGNPVLGIDIDETRATRLADTLSEAIIADGRDEEALREAGVGVHDVAVVAIGEDLEANILCTMNLRVLGVKTVWVKAISKTHHRILAKMEVDRVILAEQEMGQHVAQMLHNPLVRDYVSLGNGYHVVDLRVPEAIQGRPVGDEDLLSPYDIVALGLMRDSTFIPCDDGAARLQTDDKLLLLGKRQDLRAFADNLKSGQ